MRLDELAEKIGAKVVGDPAVEVTSAATLANAGPGQLSFLTNAKYMEELQTTKAAAVIVSNKVNIDRLPTLQSPDPYYAFQQAVVLLHGWRKHPHAGIHPKANIDPTAQVGEGTVVYPGVYIGPRAKVGRDCIVYPNVVIYDDTVIGDRCIFHAGCTIGVDGFGYAQYKGEHHKIPQIGRVVVGRYSALGTLQSSLGGNEFLGHLGGASVQRDAVAVRGMNINAQGRILEVTDSISRGDNKHHIGMVQFQGTPTTPAAPTNLYAQATGTMHAELFWKDNSAVETGFTIDICKSNFQNGWYIRRVHVPANTTSALIDGLDPATKYYFRVRADNIAAADNTSQSFNSNTATATTYAPPVNSTPKPGARPSVPERMADLLEI